MAASSNSKIGVHLDSSPPVPKLLEFADELARACRHCAPISPFRIADGIARNFIPQPAEDTATVTFVEFEGTTYAVTAFHVVESFARIAEIERADPEGYFVPSEPGVSIQPPFVRPPLPAFGGAPDVALRPIDARLPAHVGKEAFRIVAGAEPEFPVSYAMAAGYPTKSKFVRKTDRGERLAMPCVHAMAEGVGSSAGSSQIQFYSEIESQADVIAMSGTSGGPVFWSDGERYGLLGFVKEALDGTPKLGEDSISSNPRVHFIAERASYEIFGDWIAYVDKEFPQQRDKFNERIATMMR